MKKIISVFAVVALLASLFCVNASAAVPTSTGGEWSVLLSDDFDSGKATYFKNIRGSLNGVTYVPEAEGSDNTVIDLKLGEQYTQLETDAGYGKYYNNVRIGAGSQGKDTIANGVVLDGTYMIEFDVNAINPVVNLAIGVRGTHSSANAAAMCVKLNPNKMEANTWYTYRIVVESTDTADINEETTTVYRKLRGSSDGFEILEGATIGSWNGTQADNKDYGIYGMYLNDTITFGITAARSYAKPYINGINTAVEDMVVGHDGKTLASTVATNNYTAALDTHYQIDNITVYTKSAEADYELKQGIIKQWDMEPGTDVPLKGKIYENSKWVTYAFNEAQAEASGNNYVKYTPSATFYSQQTDYFVDYPAAQALPQNFILSFDANNTVLGAGLDVVVNGEGSKDENGAYVNGTYPKSTFTLKSAEATQGKWYSYKIVCSATPGVSGNYNTAKLYRKERDKNEPYVLLSGKSEAGKNALDLEYDYSYYGTMSSSKDYVNMIRFGNDRRAFLGYYTKTLTPSTPNIPVFEEGEANHNAVWLIDNIMLTEANALTADFAVAENVLSADVNLSTAAATSAPVLAVYDGDRLVDVDFEAISANVGSKTLKVDYDLSTLTDPSAKLFVWESMGEAPLIDAIDIAKYIAE